MQGLPVEQDVPLAPMTTLELGGHARYLVRAADEQTVVTALQWGRARDLPVLVLGGGSNVVIADAGWPGLVILMQQRGISLKTHKNLVWATVAAGEPWDGFVADMVARDLAGIECLSGIPGSAGATPIQNVGAYGQEVGDILVEVRVLDRHRLTTQTLGVDACALGYRDSLFKREPGRFLVLSVTFALRPHGSPTLRYRELTQRLDGQSNPRLSQVRQAVLELRRRKSMVIEPNDPNRRSVGSFFTNPVVSRQTFAAMEQQVLKRGIVNDPAQIPRFEASDGTIKIPAAWLIEAAGFRKGDRRGAVGISSQHALALVHHGGGQTQALLGLAHEIQQAVQQTFGIMLVPEPVFVGLRQ